VSVFSPGLSATTMLGQVCLSERSVVSDSYGGCRSFHWRQRLVVLSATFGNAWWCCGSGAIVLQGSCTRSILLSAGQDYNVALKTNGTLWAWGTTFPASWRWNNQQSSSPVAVATNKTWAAVSRVGFTRSRWAPDVPSGAGGKTSRELGTEPRSVFRPSACGHEQDRAAVSVGANHTLGLLHRRYTVGVGYNYWGELGDWHHDQCSRPVPVAPTRCGPAVSRGVESHTPFFALATDGTL